MSDHCIETPNGRMFARVWTPVVETSGVPVILIHDSLGCVELWRDFPARLSTATQRRVIAYDRLGFGRSDARTDELTASFVQQEAEIYIPCLLQSFRIDRFVPFGHSVGGGMAICCGAALPDACAAIITESAQMFAEDKTLHAIAAAKVDYTRSERFEKLKRYHGEKTPWVLRAWTDTWLSREFASWSVRPQLARLRCPLLAIHGELDEFGSLDHLAVARASSPSAVTTHILSDQGHVPHKENPDRVLHLVAPFLASVPSAVTAYSASE